MQQGQAPDRNRWTWCVNAMWGVAIFVGVASLIMIGAFSNGPGGGDVFLWIAAFAQTFGAVLMAGLFSMVNSIYQNSCDLLTGGRVVEAPSVGEAVASGSTGVEAGADSATGRVTSSRGVDGRKGVQIQSVKAESPLYCQVQPGDVLLSVNGQDVTSERDAANQIISGMNRLEVLEAGGGVSILSLDMRPGPLHLATDR